MKKTTIMRIASTLLIAVLLTTCAIGATFAKYTSQVSGSDQTTVAKWEWAFDINDVVTTGDSTEINLFEDTELFDLDEDGKVSAEKDDAIKAGLIAPGVGGSFVIKVKNTSEVNAIYTITLSEEEGETLPIEYSIDNTTWYGTFAEINANEEKFKDIEIAMETETATEVTVYWRWTFEGNANDTNFGVTAAQGTPDTATITVAIKADQVD